MGKVIHYNIIFIYEILEPNLMPVVKYGYESWTIKKAQH